MLTAFRSGSVFSSHNSFSMLGASNCFDRMAVTVCSRYFCFEKEMHLPCKLSSRWHKWQHLEKGANESVNLNEKY